MTETDQMKIDLAIMLQEATLNRSLSPVEKDAITVAVLLDAFAILDEEQEVA